MRVPLTLLCGILLFTVSVALQRAPAAAQPQTEPKTAGSPSVGAPGLATPGAAAPSPRPLASPGPQQSMPASPSPSPLATAGASGNAPRAGMPASTAQFGTFQELRTVQRPLVFAELPVANAESAALAVSPDIAGAQARLQESKYSLAAARSGIAPSFISNYAQVPQGNPPLPNIISRQVTAGIAITVGDFIAYSPAVREAAFNVASAQADLAAAVATERVKVVGFYFDALRARAVAAARRDALTLATSELRAARIRAENGDAPELDVVRAEVAQSKATADSEIAAADDSNAREALAIETTTPDGTFAETTPTEFAAIEPKLTDPQTVVALARIMRPELVSVRLAADAARAAIRSARAAGFPLLTVSGGYLVGTDSDVPVHAPTINAQVAIPLSSANSDRVKAAEARGSQAQFKAAATERQILLDVAASARTLGASGRASLATTRARQAAETELRATETGYRSGASSSLEVTFARLSYTQAVVDELSALYDLEKARATLDIEIGR